MSPEELERFCARAADLNVIITPELASGLLLLSEHKKQQVLEILHKKLNELRTEVTSLLLPLEHSLSAFLTRESLSRTFQEIALFARSPLADLRLSDVRTEVLASWLAETETSDSSSGCADGESAGELPTPSRNDDALPLKHAASVTVSPSEEKGERP